MAATSGADHTDGKPVRSTTRGSARRLATDLYKRATAVIWKIYITFLAGPTRLIVPDHTRDAYFQLWCDLRTNVPKDQKWLVRRLTALKPRTPSGWIAMGAFALFASAGGCVLLCCSLVALALATYAAMGIGIVAGLVGAATMLFFAGFFFVATLVTGWLAACTLAGYTWLRLAVATSNFAYTLLKRIAPAPEDETSGQSKQGTSVTSAEPLPAATLPPKEAEAQAQQPSGGTSEASRVLPGTTTSTAAADLADKPAAALQDTATTGHRQAAGGAGNGSTVSKAKPDSKHAKLPMAQDLPEVKNQILQPVS